MSDTTVRGTRKQNTKYSGTYTWGSSFTLRLKMEEMPAKVKTATVMQTTDVECSLRKQVHSR